MVLLFGFILGLGYLTMGLALAIRVDAERDGSVRHRLDEAEIALIVAGWPVVMFALIAYYLVGRVRTRRWARQRDKDARRSGVMR